MRTIVSEFLHESDGIVVKDHVQSCVDTSEDTKRQNQLGAEYKRRHDEGSDVNANYIEGASKYGQAIDELDSKSNRNTQ